MKKEVILLFILLISLVSAQYIFHVDVEVIPKTISPGENVIVNTNIKSLGLSSNEKIDVKISYEIQDENGKMIDMESSTVALQTSLSVSEVFKLSDDIKSGKYNVIVKVDYQGYKTSALDSFYVTKNTFLDRLNILISENPIIYIILFLLIIIILIWWAIHHHYAHHKR
ncbi:MAG: hypothetical protein AABX45_00255 [Nanoarchaeota archaeon]